MRLREAIVREGTQAGADDRDLARLLLEVLLDIRESLVDLVLMASEPEE